MKKDYTRLFQTAKSLEDREQRKQTAIKLNVIINALEKKGYNPITQIQGYILSNDPTYITNYEGAREKIMAIGAYDLVDFLIKEYYERR